MKSFILFLESLLSFLVFYSFHTVAAETAKFIVVGGDSSYQRQFSSTTYYHGKGAWEEQLSTPSVGCEQVAGLADRVVIDKLSINPIEGGLSAENAKKLGADLTLYPELSAALSKKNLAQTFFYSCFNADGRLEIFILLSPSISNFDDKPKLVHYWASSKEKPFLLDHSGEINLPSRRVGIHDFSVVRNKIGHIELFYYDPREQEIYHSWQTEKGWVPFQKLHLSVLKQDLNGAIKLKKISNIFPFINQKGSIELLVQGYKESEYSIPVLLHYYQVHELDTSERLFFKTWRMQKQHELDIDAHDVKFLRDKYGNFDVSYHTQLQNKVAFVARDSLSGDLVVQFHSDLSNNIAGISFLRLIQSYNKSEKSWTWDLKRWSNNRK